MTAARFAGKYFLLSLVAATVVAIGINPAKAATYYISQSAGDDASDGQAAAKDGAKGPWKTLTKASSVTYAPGDRILLKCGDTWNEELHPQGNGTPDNPITIASYGEGNKPLIDRVNEKEDLIGINFKDQEGFKIVGIEFAHCMTGLYGEYSAGSPTKKYIWIEDCYFRDSLTYGVYMTYPKPRNISLGICFFSYERDKKIVLQDVTVKNCVFRRLASAIWTNSPDNFNKNAHGVYNFANFVFEDCLFDEGSQWQQGMRGVDGGAMRNCVTVDVGRNNVAWNGVAGSMFFRCKDWVFENCEWGFISIGPKDKNRSGDGEAFDFEGDCKGMVMRDCLFHDTEGPGFLLCCYASSPIPNTAIDIKNCVLNGKATRTHQNKMPKCEIINTTDWNETTWTDCRFYLSPGEVIMRTMDPEKDKKSVFVNCGLQFLSVACAAPKLDGKLSASSETAGSEAAKAGDSDTATAWQAGKAEDQWIEIDFGKPTAINEFKIDEPAGKVSRYVIQCWDEKTSKWVGCFNGIAIGANFVAPIVSRTTPKARLLIMKTSEGNPAIAGFEAYNSKPEQIFDAPRGTMPPARVGK